MIFVAYELNLPLNMEKPHYCSQRAGEWSLIWAHDSRPIYRALTYIAVPLLGPHQPRYIRLTLYQFDLILKCWSYNGSVNGLMLFRWQSIIWTNEGLDNWHIFVTQPQWVKRDRNDCITKPIRMSCGVFFFFFSKSGLYFPLSLWFDLWYNIFLHHTAGLTVLT